VAEPQKAGTDRAVRRWNEAVEAVNTGALEMNSQQIQAAQAATSSFAAEEKIKHAETEAVRQEARQRHAREDTGGRSSAAAAGLPAQIPLNTSTADLKKYSSEQIRGWMKRRRNAGLAV
jgi:hypothetical protein